MRDLDFLFVIMDSIMAVTEKKVFFNLFKSCKESYVIQLREKGGCLILYMLIFAQSLYGDQNGI